jgi:hypothetical protein
MKKWLVAALGILVVFSLSANVDAKSYPSVPGKVT